MLPCFDVFFYYVFLECLIYVTSPLNTQPSNKLLFNIIVNTSLCFRKKLRITDSAEFTVEKNGTVIDKQFLMIHNKNTHVYK